MSEVSPIRGIRPRPELAARIVAPPYDVLDSEEARALADGNPQSWLHVSKPEIDLAPDVDHYDASVYTKARENYAAFLDAGWFIQDAAPCFYIYRLSIDGHTQTGILAGASVREYEAGLIKKHELTRADKEIDRTRHTEILEAHSGPVFLAYRKRSAIDALVAQAVSVPPDYDVKTYDGVRNELWVITDSSPLQAAFREVPALYIADGHHRAASYCRVGGARRDANPSIGAASPDNVFLAVIFPHDQLRILPYNRYVLDLNGLTPEAFLSRVAEKFTVTSTATATPSARHQIAMYLGGKWMGLTPKPGTFDEENPISSLDVSILQTNLLAPILGIADPRRDNRIDFIGGIRGTGELERRVREGVGSGYTGGAGVAFSMYPTSLDELMAIADAGEIMPPKSTWFEPKLKDGFVIHSLVEARRPAASSIPAR